MKTFPVVEIFGPTIQGEGPLIGVPTMFVRFGGCDYRCSWCDTLYAVLPEEVRKNSTQMTVEQIVGSIDIGRRYCEWVTLSGGNPLLHDLEELVDQLRKDGWRVAVETQGTVYHEWVQNTLLIVSPKPPSSGMSVDFKKLGRFMSHDSLTLKIVIFDDEDFEFAVQVRQKFPDPKIPLTLQIGNHVGEDSLFSLTEKLRWLVKKVTSDERLFNVRVLPQLHVWLWGNSRGF